MSVALEKPRFVQAFNSVEPTAERPQPLLYNEFILPWARKLPKGRIIDLAAGNCVEAKLLTREGFDCLAIDASPTRLEAGNFPNSRVGTVDHIEAPNSSVSGILLKDTLVFLSPETRIDMLEEAKRVLVPGGSILIISQLSGLRIHSVPKDSKYPIKDIYPDNTDWQEKVASLKEDQLIAVEFQTTPATTTQEAAATGLQCTTLLSYDFKHPIAKENRWIERNGFICRIEKPRG